VLMETSPIGVAGSIETFARRNTTQKAAGNVNYVERR